MNKNTKQYRAILKSERLKAARGEKHSFTVEVPCRDYHSRNKGEHKLVAGSFVTRRLT